MKFNFSDAMIVTKFGNVPDEDNVIALFWRRCAVCLECFAADVVGKTHQHLGTYHAIAIATAAMAP